MITKNDIQIDYLNSDGFIRSKILTYKNYQRSVKWNSIHDFKDWKMQSFWIKLYEWDDIEQYVNYLNVKLTK